MTELQAFMGRSIPDGGFVGRAALQRFVRDAVSPRFDGFTLTAGKGYWRGSAEEVAVLSVITDNPTADQLKMREIAQAYKDRFRQESVLITARKIEADFI